MPDLRLINPSGTVVTLTDDESAFNPITHVFHFNVEQELRDAGYRELEDGEAIPPQHWEAAELAAASESFAGRAMPAAAVVEESPVAESTPADDAV